MFEKLIELARAGKGRRMLNALTKKDLVLSPDELDRVLKTYRDNGLPTEVEILKTQRGILREDQYDDLAQKVWQTCCAEHFDQFQTALRDLISCGIKMNPAKMEQDRET